MPSYQIAGELRLIMASESAEQQIARTGRTGDWEANSAIAVAVRMSTMACWACTQTGCAGQWNFLAQLFPETRQTFKEIGPSMASMTSSIEAWRPRGKIANPPDFPLQEEMSSARDKACKTFERKLSGASVAAARAGSSARSFADSVAR